MTAASLPSAVLWDMDGTLVDTEPYWIAEERAVIEAAGGSWSDDDALALVGSDLLVAAEIILASTPVSGTAQQLVERLLAGVVRRTKEHLPWRPGARELLEDCLAHGVPCALVTMSWTELAGLLVQVLPEGTFAAVVTGDQVEHGKPHPQPYQEAARRLGVSPGECVAIEDSPTGVRSAVAAGVPTIGVAYAVPIPAELGARPVETLVGVSAHQLVTLSR